MSSIPMKAELTDEAIATAVQGGDAESFGILMERYEPKLTRYARRFVADPDRITDLVQDVFIKAYTNIQSFDASRAFSPWIYRIAHNEFVNAVKKRVSEKLFALDFDLILPQLAAPESTDSESHRREEKEMLEKCLDQIPAKYREPLVLYYFEEMEYKEISEIMQIPTNTVGVRLQRGKVILKKIISENGGRI